MPFAVVSARQSCSGCHKANCAAVSHRFPVDSALGQGPIAVDIAAKDLALLVVNSLGLPLVGLMLGVFVGRYVGLHEGLQLVLAVIGLSLGALSCRGYAQSIINIYRVEEEVCSL